MDRSWERKADRWQTIGDRALVEALRAEEPEALDEFITRFESLVQRYARQLKVPVADRAHWAAELLYDVAATLTRGVGEPPGHLAAYIAGACRMRVRRQRVREAHHEALMYRALDQIGTSTVLVRLEEKVRSGTVVVARDPDHGYVVKEVGPLTAEGIELRSLNRAYRPFVVPYGPGTVLGTVVLRWCPHPERHAIS